MSQIACSTSLKWMRFLAVWVLSAAGISLAAPSETIPESLMAVHEAYTNGDFEVALSRIEAYQKQHRRPSLADSVFIAKHLAVIYGSNPQTREKGRYYMFRMLEMNPNSDLVDMFISQDLDEVFEKVRKEFLVRQNRSQSVKTSYAPPPEKTEKAERTLPVPVARPAPKPSSKTWLWVVGGAAVAAGVVTAYYLTLDTPSEGKDIPLD